MKVNEALKGYRRPAKAIAPKKAQRDHTPPKYPDGHIKCATCKGAGHHKKEVELSATDMALERA